MALYPSTQAVIDKLLEQPKFEEKFSNGAKIIMLAQVWKVTHWKIERKKSNREKLIAIAKLLSLIDTEINNGNRANIAIEEESSWMPSEVIRRIRELSSDYDPDEKVITLRGKASIITGLHELGHHLYGDDELTACIFSISLFKIVFPKAFAKLNWDGHMLKL